MSLSVESSPSFTTDVTSSTSSPLRPPLPVGEEVSGTPPPSPLPSSVPPPLRVHPAAGTLSLSPPTSGYDPSQEGESGGRLPSRGEAEWLGSSSASSAAPPPPAEAPQRFPVSPPRGGSATPRSSPSSPVMTPPSSSASSLGAALPPLRPLPGAPGDPAGSCAPPPTVEVLRPLPDLWKTPFWIIEDFQAPCQGCPAPGDRRGAGTPGVAATLSPGWGPGTPVSRQPPYYDLEPEDLACYMTLHPPGSARVRDSELMDVPDEDLEFWSRFYFSGVEKARELICQRQHPLNKWQ